MYAVIFKAHIKALDEHYTNAAQRMRELAIQQYGCVDFSSVTEGDREITLSYWNSEADIQRWKQDPQHIEAQNLGRSRWYASYTVEIVEIKRHYSHTEQATGSS